MKFEIRFANKNDEDLIKKIHKESGKHIGSFNLFYVWDNYLAQKNTYKYYVIENIGFIRCGYSKMKKCYTIKEIGVLNEFKGKGYAEALFNKCRTPMYLTCNVDNVMGNRFYDKMGMRKKSVILSKNGKHQMNLWVK
jgi:ribosomal protein S18 acetylase RimI-like enzyme